MEKLINEEIKSIFGNKICKYFIKLTIKSNVY